MTAMFRRILNRIQAQPRWRIVVAAAAIVAAALWLGRGSKGSSDVAMFIARRGPLQISVLEGGTMQAINSQELKCEVRVGYQGTKILRIVDEGYQVTDDDVKSGKILVELDSSELQKQLVQQEIVFQTAAAALADAQQGYDIQLIQNTSDILGAEQKARFARMDFSKFLGSDVAEGIIKQLGIDESTNSLPIRMTPPPTNQSDSVPPAREETVPELATNAAVGPAALKMTGVLLASVTVPPGLMPGPAVVPTNSGAIMLRDVPKPSSIHWAEYADIKKLGDGEAMQKIRKFDDDFQVAQKEVGQAEATRDGTRRLHKKQFVTSTDLQRDEIAYENARLKVVTAETARALFLNYDFLRTAEETLSKYAEAMRDLERTRKSAYAKLAQADARLRSATAQYNVQFRQKQDLEQQIARCTIRAEKPGLVIYGRAGDDMVFYGGEERIREGAPVRERQTILTIPDMSRMGVKVKIHETYIKKIKSGQKVRITVDAFPDKILEGEVMKVGVLPDSQNRWMNPDMKVYLTTINVNGTNNEWLKPGMSTKVEIMVDRLEDVVYVPMQCVVPENGRFACYVANGSHPERRDVEVGEFNDEFIEVTKGVSEGDLVLLHPPRSINTTEEEPKSNGTSAPPARVTPAQQKGTNGTVTAGQARREKQSDG